MTLKTITFRLAILLLVGCANLHANTDAIPPSTERKSLPISNETIKQHKFLKDMYGDDYYPQSLVQELERVLLNLCARIEITSPKSEEELYALTHEATERINELAEKFYKQGSEIETAAREAIGMDFHFIAMSYGFDADVEELIAPREW